MYWSSYEYEYDGAYAMIVHVSVRTILDSAIGICMNLGMRMGSGMNMNMIQRRGRGMNMHMDMNMNMSMHMRMGTNTNRVIALGTTIVLHLNPYENNGGYVCGHSCLSCYA